MLKTNGVAHEGLSSTELAVEKRKKVEARIGKSRTRLYAAIAAGTFPRPIKLGPRSVGWLTHEVDRWIEDRIAERDAKAKQ